MAKILGGSKKKITGIALMIIGLGAFLLFFCLGLPMYLAALNNVLTVIVFIPLSIFLFIIAGGGLVLFIIGLIILLAYKRKENNVIDVDVHD